MPTLFTPLKVDALTLPNRIIMAPLTRLRAGAGHIPNDLMATYYAQRAGGADPVRSDARYPAGYRI